MKRYALTFALFFIYGFTALTTDAANPEFSATLHKAEKAQFPSGTDCNSPTHWDDGVLYIFNSTGHPTRSYGEDILHLGNSKPIVYSNEVDGGRWIEATFREEDGTLYGWYHNEPTKGFSQNKVNETRLTAPKIGAVKSTDNGANWEDLGFVLEAPADSLNLETENFYFAGGNGDFSVLPDAAKEYIYFYISTYNKDIGEQGVSVARMKFADRDAPVGKVTKWHNGEWSEPGLEGHVTPIFAAQGDWHGMKVDAFWGPSIHWNTYLKQYVILLNRAKDSRWGQEGIYVTFNDDLGDPKGWSEPHRILEGGGWYPQVVGLDKEEQETDKRAGQTARFYLSGVSEWEIEFKKADK